PGTTTVAASVSSAVIPSTPTVIAASASISSSIVSIAPSSAVISAIPSTIIPPTHFAEELHSGRYGFFVYEIHQSSQYSEESHDAKGGDEFSVHPTILPQKRALAESDFSLVLLQTPCFFLHEDTVENHILFVFGLLQSLCRVAKREEDRMIAVTLPPEAFEDSRHRRITLLA
ncbi:MAG: hypothetical protein Greene101449_799, partial [Candidatus Peregrinibacteria bacterium Greene1014_49]